MHRATWGHGEPQGHALCYLRARETPGVYIVLPGDTENPRALHCTTWGHGEPRGHASRCCGYEEPQGHAPCYWGHGEPLNASVSVESHFVGLLGQP